MLVITPSFQVDSVDYPKILKAICSAGRTCYKSDLLYSTDKQEIFIESVLIERGHESVLEHCSISVRIVCDRGISHELVRHRIASYSQESTRFCNYSKDRFGNQITVIKPVFFPQLSSGEYKNGNDFYGYSLSIQIWAQAMLNSETAYFRILDQGLSPQEARSVLPNSLKTEIVMTQNIRQWRHFFKLRALGTTGKPHPQMLEITVPMLKKFQELMPVFFKDLIK